MTATIGLERLPHTVVRLLDEAAANLLGIANDLDVLVAHGPETALTAIELREGEGDRITHDLIDAARASHRAGPDRNRIVELSQALDDVVDGVSDLAWAWSRWPIARLAELVLRVRDVVRSAAAMARAVEANAGVAESLDRAGETVRAARLESRAARSWLLTGQSDPELAIAGQGVATAAEQLIRACLGLRAGIERHILA